MSDPFIAEVRIFPFRFAPTGWAFCAGQLLPISQNTALFSLLGTTYGGDGKSTFALPNLEGSIPMHPDQGNGLSMHFLGEASGSDSVTLLESEMATHNHTLGVWPGDPADHYNPSGMTLARSNNGNAWAAPSALTPMAVNMVAPNGGSLPHNNLMSYLTLNFCIALQGAFPARP